MDAIKFIKESKRMCKSFSDNCACAECPANSGLCKISHYYECSAEEKLSIVEKWSNEHPAKIRQSVFDILCVCPAEIFGDTVCQKGRALCSDCRHKFWMQEVE